MQYIYSYIYIYIYIISKDTKDRMVLNPEKQN